MNPEVLCLEHLALQETKTRCLRWYDLTELGCKPAVCRLADQLVVVRVDGPA
jgi:hypothetical protein